MNTRFRNVSIIVVLVLLMTLSASSQSSRAAVSWYVAPGGSDGSSCQAPDTPCATINAAIEKAGEGDTIYVAIGRYTGREAQVVYINKDLTLSGGWDDSFSTQVGHSTIDGQGFRRGMTVDYMLTTATIDRFIIQRGLAPAPADGGGIAIYYATMTINNSIIRDSRSDYGDGILVFEANLTLNDSVVSHNASHGIMNYFGDVMLNNSTVHDNHADCCAGIFNSGTVTLNNSTVSDNHASGVPGVAGGIRNDFTGTLILNNSTISGNSASAEGGGIHNDGSVILQNTILADNTALSAPDCLGTLTTAGYNLIGDTTGCDFTPGTGDLTGLDANLGALIGAPTTPPYHPLLSGSPAIDAGNPSGCMGSLGPLDADQRGAARVGICDIGSYEYTMPGPPSMAFAHSGSDQYTPPDNDFELPLVASVLDIIGSPVGGITVTFTAPASGASGTFANTGSNTTTAQTNESGLAAASPFTTNELSGSYTVTATVEGVANPALFRLSNSTGDLYTSTSGDDGNTCLDPRFPCATLYEAYDRASPGRTIYVAQGTYTGTQFEVLLIDKDIALSGGWDNSFEIQSGISTVDGEEERRGITVSEGVTATIDSLVIQNGLVNNDVGGGIKNQGTLTLTRSIIRNNQAGIDTFGSAAGIYNSGVLTLEQSAVSDNHTGNEYFNDAGGIMNDNGTATLVDSTVSDNSCGDNGGKGGGIYNHNGGNLVLNNSTISGNHTTGITNGYPVIAHISINSSTISNNDGYGIINYAGTILMQNTILAGNSGEIDPGGDCLQTIYSDGYNLIGNTTYCDFRSEDGDLLDVDARLSELTGEPGYHPLSRISPAVNAGNPNGCTDHEGNLLDTDQRGVARIGRCDIGSYEYDPATDPFNYLSLPIVFHRICPAFLDDFSDPTSGWPIGDDGIISYEYLNGEYRILLREAGWWAGAHPGFQASDYELETDVRNVTGVYGEYGLIFGLDENWSQFYALFIDPEGYFGIFRYDDFSGWIQLAVNFSSSIHQGTATNRLKVERNGISINVYANGNLLASLTDGTYTGLRYMGLIIGTLDQPNLDVRFDNFSAESAACFAPTGSTSIESTLPGTGAQQDADAPRWAVGKIER